MADASPSTSSSPTDLLSRFLATSPTLVQEKLRSVFDNIDLCMLGFVQFWAPVKTFGCRWFLTTSDQPFALREHRDGVKKCRLCSVRYRYNVDVNNLEIDVDLTIINGAPARAFLNRLPEFLPDLRVHRMSPLESCAFQCRLFRSLLLPVLHLSEKRCCVGVVECCSVSFYGLDRTFSDLSIQFEREGLKTFRASPPYKDDDHVEFSSSLEDSQTKRMFGLKLTGCYSTVEGWCEDDYVFKDYSTICNKLPLKIGEGLIWKTLKDYKPCFIKKVSKLNDNQPLVMVRDCYGLGDPFECSCFVICLRSTKTSNLDYVFEFLWHKGPNYATLLESLLLLLKRCLPDFKSACGGELGDELSVIEMKDSTKNKIEYIKIFKGNRSLLASEALEKSSSVVKERLTPLVAKCKTTPSSLSEEGIIEATKNLYVSLKRKRKDQSDTNEEDKVAFKDTSVNNREMYMNENTVTVKAEYGDDMIKFHLPILSATFAAIEKEIGEGFKLNPGNYKLKYLDEDGDWILMASDKDVRVCIKDLRNSSNIVRLRLLPVPGQLPVKSL